MEKPEIIQQLETTLPTIFKKVNIDEIMEFIPSWEHTAKYATNQNGNIIGLCITGFNLTDVPEPITNTNVATQRFGPRDSTLLYLTHLNLYMNKISNITPLLELKNITNLNLDHNQIKDISPLLGLKNITYLNLGQNELSNISLLRELKNIKGLFLDATNINDISPLRKLKNITELHLKGNLISDISPLRKLKNITELDLYANPIKNLSPLRKLKYIKRLYLWHLQINDISPLQYLKNIEELELLDNKISDLSPLRNLVNIIKLNLNSNKISNISPLEKLINITELNLSDNKISDISPLRELKNIAVLNLNSNQISNISPLLGLKNITSLYIEYNRLSDISLLREFKNIRRLYLSGNLIGDISPLLELKNITNLTLEHNKISDISPLRELKILERLDLRRNPIRILPKWICDFPNMDIQWDDYHNNKCFIKFYENPLESPPIEVIKQGKKAIKDWYESQRVVNNEIKLILTGNTTVGKTSLIDFLENKYNPDDKSREFTTHGIKLRTWKTNNLVVNVWDFGGQDYYHATHYLFFTSNSVYLLLWEKQFNKTAKFETTIQIEGNPEKEIVQLHHYDYYHWLKLIRKYDSGSTNSKNPSDLEDLSPILMIQNKIDLPDNEKETIKNDALKIYGITDEDTFAVSILKTYQYRKNKESNKELKKYNNTFENFEERLNEILKTKTEGKQIVKYYKEIRDMVREKSQNLPIITFEEYKRLCHLYAQEEISIDQIRFATTYLHDTGVLLYYGYQLAMQQSILADYVFLSSQYVTDTIYKILNRNILESEGKFTRTHVESIIGKSETDLFIKLMQSPNFELIFEYRHEPETYFATQYLPEKLTGKAFNYFQRDIKCLPISFVMRFDKFFSLSIISRFIARFGFYSEKAEADCDVLWKYGISFTRRECPFLVYCDFEQQKIYVRTEKGQLKNDFITEIYNTLLEIADNDRNSSISLDDKEFDPIENIEKYKVGKYTFCLKNNQETLSIKENNIKVEGNGNIILQDINGNDITINYNDTEKLNAVIEEFKRSQSSEYKHIVQSLEFIKQTIIWIKNAIQPIDQIKELVYKIAENQEKGFSGLHKRHNRHDESLSIIENQLQNFENIYKQGLSPELQIEFENIKNLILEESKQNALAIVNELMDWIDTAEKNLSKELAEVYKNLKKSDNWQIKMKFAIPLLSVLGIGISIEHETKLNNIIKNIGTRMKQLINK